MRQQVITMNYTTDCVQRMVAACLMVFISKVVISLLLLLLYVQAIFVFPKCGNIKIGGN